MEERPPYVLLVPRGLEAPAQCLLASAGLRREAVTPLPLAVAPPGHALGKAGEAAPLAVHDAETALPSSVLGCAALMGALATIFAGAVPTAESAATSEELVADAGISRESFQAAFRVLLRHRPDLVARLGCDSTSASSAARASSGTSSSAESLSYRVVCERGGRHSTGVGARRLSVAVAAQLEAAWEGEPPRWRVDMARPDVLVLAVLAQERLLVGFILPPFREAGSHGLPRIPRPWFIDAAKRRPHLNVARAACLARLAGLESLVLHVSGPPSHGPGCGDTLDGGGGVGNRAGVAAGAVDEAAPEEEVVLLDPLGGLGIMAIEAASAVRRVHRRALVASSSSSSASSSASSLDATNPATDQREHGRRLRSFRAVSMDLDASACAVARAHAKAAGFTVVGGGGGGGGDDDDSEGDEVDDDVEEGRGGASRRSKRPKWTPLVAAAAAAAAERNAAVETATAAAVGSGLMLRGNEHQSTHFSAAASAAADVTDAATKEGVDDEGSTVGGSMDAKIRASSAVEVAVGDALRTGLPDASVDVVVSELPFGKAYRRLDVGRLLRELHRILKPPTDAESHSAVPESEHGDCVGDAEEKEKEEEEEEEEEGPEKKRRKRSKPDLKNHGLRLSSAAAADGACGASAAGASECRGTVLLVGAEGGGGTARALQKAAARHPFEGAWRLESATPFAVGGIDALAVILRRLPRKEF